MDDELIIIDHSKRKKVTYEPWELSLLKLFEDRQVPEPLREEPEPPQEEPEHSLSGAFGVAGLLFSGGGIALALMGALVPAAGCIVLATAAVIGFVVA